MIDLKVAFTAEREMRKRTYDLTIDQAIRRLEEAKGRAVTTHLGHNLASLAHDLSVAAAQHEAADVALRTLAQEEYEK